MKSTHKILSKTAIFFGAVWTIFAMIPSYVLGNALVHTDSPKQAEQKQLSTQQKATPTTLKSHTNKESLIFEQLSKKINHEKQIYHYLGC